MREGKNLASRTTRGTVQQESTRSVCHSWMLVICRRREVQIDLLFYSGRLRRPLQKILFFIAAA
jgi:hypothetical protein